MTKEELSVPAGAAENRKAHLLLLAERCEREEPSRELDAKIFAVKSPGWNAYSSGWADFPGVTPPTLIRVADCTSSLDAAVTLVPIHNGRRWFWRVGESTLYKGWAHLNRVHPDHCDRKDEASANAKTPALALCAAALRALAHEAEHTTKDRPSPATQSVVP